MSAGLFPRYPVVPACFRTDNKIIFRSKQAGSIRRRPDTYNTYILPVFYERAAPPAPSAYSNSIENISSVRDCRQVRNRPFDYAVLKVCRLELTGGHRPGKIAALPDVRHDLFRYLRISRPSNSKSTGFDRCPFMPALCALDILHKGVRCHGKNGDGPAVFSRKGAYGSGRLIPVHLRHLNIHQDQA